MKILSFELTMPNKGSWSGKWSGEDKKYYVIKKVSDKYFNSKEHFKKMIGGVFGSAKPINFHYSWGDGWGANVRVEIVDSKEAAKRRKLSKGFCGYEWMIDSITYHGAIYASHDEIPVLPSYTPINDIN